MFAPDADPTLTTARAAAQGGEWARVRELFDGQPVARELSDAALLLAEASLRLGLPERARLWLGEVIPVFETRRDRAALRRGVNMLGAACWELGELDDAESAWDRAILLAQADGDTLLLANATNNLGALANLRGRRENALGMYHLAIPAYQRLGHAVGIAQCYHNIAITYRDARDFAQADEYEQRAIEFAHGAGSERLVALARLGRAEITFRRGDTQLAGASARRVAEDFARLTDPIREGDARRLSGLAHLADGRPDMARREIAQALELARQHQGALVEAESLRALAELESSLGDLPAARGAAEEAIAIWERLGSVEEVAAMREWLDLLPARSR